MEGKKLRNKEYHTKINIEDARQRGHKKHHSHQQLNQSAAHPSIDDGLYLLVGPVTEVAEGPTSVCQHIGVAMEQEARQYREAGGDAGEVWGRVLPPTQVAESPHSVAGHGEAS